MAKKPGKTPAKAPAKKPAKKTAKSALTRKANAVTEEINRSAARTSIKAAKKKPLKKIASPRVPGELEEGLRESFPASDPPTATRPANPVEDRRERKPRK